MRQTNHIHIKGLVQGVGFRPHVCRLAADMNMKGWICNSNDGVHIEVTGDESQIKLFYRRIIHQPPPNAVITEHIIYPARFILYDDFSIRHSRSDVSPDLLLTPDIAICDHCREEIVSANNRREGYAFTTCLNCGPRYSITTSLPYDRENTTMADMKMCETCTKEYDDINNCRHYSQTNSCPGCAIALHLYTSKQEQKTLSDKAIIDAAATAIAAGKIVAVKGMSGYLLLCDAANELAVQTLRRKKQRPAKPLALLYEDVETAAKDVYLHSFEIAALKTKAAPIVLCRKRKTTGNNICVQDIAPGLERMGVMLPSTPLLYLLIHTIGKPIIATSGNISGSPILFKDADALEHLFEVADMVVTYDREIVAPQDDSVLQFTGTGQKIILRRSRGLAPNYFPNPFSAVKETVLATGGELKAAFAITNNNNLYISQYLGDQSAADANDVYQNTVRYFTGLIQSEPTTILVDKHPAYAVASIGREYASEHNLANPVSIQHHEAHIAAVLAENGLLSSRKPILGFAWDGTGYGNDRQVWGSETFLYNKAEMTRVAQLAYFPVLLGDKMSREPRLSALSLLRSLHASQFIIRPCFSASEWNYYQKLIASEQPLFTSSMGRFIDGLACMLGICSHNSFEGEAAMRMEALAMAGRKKADEYYPLPLVNGVLDWNVFLAAFTGDLLHNKDIKLMSWKVFNSLAHAIAAVSEHFDIHHLAFSGGVFQNALLNELITEQMGGEKKLYFHRELSPNDECIGFGQIACYQLMKERVKFKNQQSKVKKQAEGITV